MADVMYSDEAVSDLDQIGDYIAQTLQSPIAALNTISNIQDSIEKLSTFPLMGIPLSAKVDIDTDYRFLVCGKYLAFHHVDGDNVFIDRILYGKRDYLAILFPEMQQE